MPRFFQSRKLWAAIVGLLFIFLNAFLNQTQIDPDTVTNAIMGIIAAYMASTAWEDGQKAKAAGEVNAAAMTASQPTQPSVGIDANNVTVTPSDTGTPQPRVGLTGMR